MNGGRFVVIFN